MITPDQLSNRAIDTSEITSRQLEVLTLVREYYAVAKELPSAGYLSRRLKISRQRAHAIMERLRSTR